MDPGAAGQGRRSCHRLNICHCCSPTKKPKKQKKKLSTYISHNITMVIKLSKTITMLNSQNNIILLLFQIHNPPIWLASSTPYLHLHLQHPFCIFIFNTHLASSTPHFASSSSTPI
jgi:hypothetical protein